MNDLDWEHSMSNGVSKNALISCEIEMALNKYIGEQVNKDIIGDMCEDALNTLERLKKEGKIHNFYGIDLDLSDGIRFEVEISMDNTDTPSKHIINIPKLQKGSLNG